jgi:hypothetical protein
MLARVAMIAVAAALAFLGTYAIGQASEDTGHSDAGIPTGATAPAARNVPAPAAPRLPSLRDAPSSPAPARAARTVRRAPRAAAPVTSAPAPTPSPAPSTPKPKPTPGVPFFDAE